MWRLQSHQAFESRALRGHGFFLGRQKKIWSSRPRLVKWPAPGQVQAAFNHLTMPGYLDIYCIIGVKEGIMMAPPSKSRNNWTRLADSVSRGGDNHLVTGVGVWVGAAACLSGSATVEQRRTS